MRRIRRTGTTPELAVRQSLRRLGIRYRLRTDDLPGKPDLILLSRRVAIFVHGCFWHRHDGCGKAALPRTRPEYWDAKLTRNVARDAAAASALTERGWRVLTIWECDARDPIRLDRRLRHALEALPAARGRAR